MLTTPSRLLKIIVPLTTLEQNADSKDIQPLALLVHPQQPLSYLERLIQSELPTIKTKNGDEKIPTVHFRAEDSQQDKSIPPGRTSHEETDKEKSDEETNDGLEETRIGKKTERTGKLISRASKPDVVQALGDGGVESYSGLGHEKVSPKGEKRKFVRWSSSTEIGDFIRDAARGKEFIIDIEGADRETRVDVPSFNDRTHYLRSRLRKTASQILSMEQVKRECDVAAHKSAQRVAMGGAGLLVGYWYIVYRITFETDLGWDTMEPVTVSPQTIQTSSQSSPPPSLPNPPTLSISTISLSSSQYLVGLSTLICGYLWFLYHNREVSYRSALNLTISRRRQKLYQTRGFDLPKWEALVEEGNALRREIKTVAREYDVDWDETVDEKHERVKEVLREDREEKKEKRKEKGKGKEGGEGEEDGKGAEEED